jgi:Cft2 family RNA processing exonuclease
MFVYSDSCSSFEVLLGCSHVTGDYTILLDCGWTQAFDEADVANLVLAVQVPPSGT